MGKRTQMLKKEDKWISFSRSTLEKKERDYFVKMIFWRTQKCPKVAHKCSILVYSAVLLFLFSVRLVVSNPPVFHITQEQTLFWVKMGRSKVSPHRNVGPQTRQTVPHQQRKLD